MYPNLPTNQMFTNNNLIQELDSISTSVFQQDLLLKIYHLPQLSDATTSHLFFYPKRSKRPPLQLINNFIQLYLHYGYSWYIFRVDECGDLYQLEYFVQLYFDYQIIV